VQPRGGYKTLSVIQLCNPLAAYDGGRIGHRAVRVYFAAVAQVAVREASRRSTRARGDDPCGLARYRVQELSRLTGLADADVRRELRRLGRAGLARFSECEVTIASEPADEGVALAESVSGRNRSPRRPVPVPRPLLRLLARVDRPAFTKVLLAYLIRGVSIDRRSGEVSGAGSAKLTWIADRFGLSERAARYARRELIALGILTPDTGSSQRKLNRDGAYFTVNLDWHEELRRDPTEAIVAPLVLPTTPQIAPPEGDKRTSSGTKDQQARRVRVPGLCERADRTPSLRDIRREDLTRISSVLALYEQAVHVGWLERSDANRRNFVAAAVRAARANGDAPRIFVAIVRRGLWHHITAEEEERAVAALKRSDGRSLHVIRERAARPRASGEATMAAIAFNLLHRLHVDQRPTVARKSALPRRLWA
jgi:hypothetical protein